MHGENLWANMGGVCAKNGGGLGKDCILWAKSKFSWAKKNASSVSYLSRYWGGPEVGSRFLPRSECQVQRYSCFLWFAWLRRGQRRWSEQELIRIQRLLLICSCNNQMKIIEKERNRTKLGPAVPACWTIKFFSPCCFFMFGRCFVQLLQLWGALGVLDYHCCLCCEIFELLNHLQKTGTGSWLPRLDQLRCPGQCGHRHSMTALH